MSAMWSVIGFIVATLIGWAAVLRLGRNEEVRRDDYPWLLDEVSKLHVAIVGNLAGFAFTGVVLVVTFAHETAGHAQVALDTVILLFLVAFLYWIGAAFLISYLPHIRASGDFVQRVHFSLASTIEYRTVFISWFALLPLLQANGLAHLTGFLYFAMPASLLLGSMLLAMATDGLGLVSVKETYVSAAIAAGLGLLYAAVVAIAIPGARSPYSPVYFAIVVFCVNGAGFAAATLTPLAARYDRVKHFYERHGRRLVMLDMQITMSSLVFLWLVVAGAL